MFLSLAEGWKSVNFMGFRFSTGRRRRPCYNAPMFVGLTGGIACGKSLVATYFRELGARVIDADELAHRLLEPSRPVYQAVLAVFGPSILQPPHGAAPPLIDRRRLGERIFADPVERARLEAIVHPAIFAEAARLRAEMERADREGLILFMAPLLFETGADQWVDRTIAVVADEETQLNRLMARDGLSREAALERVATQLPVADKQARADDWIDGAQPPDAVRAQVTALYRRLTGG